jgi:beta-glucosidase
VVLLMVGNKDSEGKDRPNLQLPGTQNALISAVAAANPHTIVILKTGGPVLMPWIDSVPAILEAWYPGEEDGNVVADILFGNVNPSGKLPMTFPKFEDQVPAGKPEQYPGVNGSATYSEKLLIGYRWYDSQNAEPLFPFGFGLSYTTFKFGNLSATRSSASLDLTNSGSRNGADVVQIYVESPAAANEPPKQLRAFAKVALKAGETKHVNINLDPRAWFVWDVGSSKWKVVPGEYKILAGDSSRDLPLHITITIPAGVE